MFKEIFSFLETGGVLMIPIILGSIISLAIFIERLLYLRVKNIASDKIFNDLLPLVKEDKISEALTLVKHNNDEILSRILISVFTKWDRSKDFLKELAEEKGKKEINKMERSIGVISVIAMISPLLGLLGTVTGMISVFKEFVQNQHDPSFMSSGISQALVTTAAGLIVAIPAVLGSKYLLSKSDSLVLELEEKLFELIESKNEYQEKK